MVDYEPTLLLRGMIIIFNSISGCLWADRGAFRDGRYVQYSTVQYSTVQYSTVQYERGCAEYNKAVIRHT